ncbi:hypothetical protein PC39_12842 [Salinisphaera sp. PC39]
MHCRFPAARQLREEGITFAQFAANDGADANFEAQRLPLPPCDIAYRLGSRAVPIADCHSLRCREQLHMLTEHIRVRLAIAQQPKRSVALLHRSEGAGCELTQRVRQPAVNGVAEVLVVSMVVSLYLGMPHEMIRSEL